MINKYTIPLYIFILVGLLWLGSTAQSEIDTLNNPPIVQSVADAPDFGMSFPVNYRQEFELYLIVDRPDETVRHVYADPQAVDASRADEPLPDGTQIIIETWDARINAFGTIARDDDGHYIAETMQANIHVMEKSSDWTIEQLPSPVGVIDWNFASFDADTMLPSVENRNDCMTCHDAGAFRRDFVFSQRLLAAYANTGNTQYLYCNRNGRSNCIR
ncbi:MAG: cytochrome P460 family protein [Chloroflexota bacterium]